MNKVIIDGCNVAECQYYFYEDTEKAHTCRLIQVDDDLHYICKDNPDCYFKQLQRAKAENKKLKEWLEKTISKHLKI